MALRLNSARNRSPTWATPADTRSPRASASNTETWPCRFSNVMAAAVSTQSSRRTVLSRATTERPVAQGVPLTRLNPSLAPKTSGARFMARSASVPPMHRPCKRAVPCPMSTRAMCAMCVRYPTDPAAGTSGTQSWASRASSPSTTTGRTPENPSAKLLTAAAMMGRASMRSSVGPTPTAWLIKILRDSCSCLDWVTTTSHSAPTPVFTPYARKPLRTMESTSARAAPIRACAASVRASGAPWATSATWRQESGRSRRMGCVISRLGGRRTRAPGLKGAAIALEHHTHVARTADGARLAQGDADPGDAEFFQHEHGDVLGEGFDQVKTRPLDEGQHAFRDSLVIQCVIDGVGQRPLADIGADLDVDEDGLLDLPFPIEDADDGFGLE